MAVPLRTALPLAAAAALAVALGVPFVLRAEPPAPAPGPPAGYVEVEVKDLIEVHLDDGPGFAVLLASAGPHAKVLPIFIGPAEAIAIQLRLTRMRPPRPLTHDLLESVVAKLGGALSKVHVEDLRDEVFYGRVFIRPPTGKVVSLDARPSDSIALAVGAGVPIYVASHVLARAGLDADTLDRGPPIDRALKKKKEVLSL